MDFILHAIIGPISAHRVNSIVIRCARLRRYNEAIIRWTSNNPGGTDEHWGVVKYGTDPDTLNLTAKGHIRLNRQHPYTVFRVRVPLKGSSSVPPVLDT